MQEHLDSKDFLLGAKKGDEQVILYYIDGWRYCTVSMGSKYMTAKPLYGKPSTAKKISARQGKQELQRMYWRAAAIDAHYKALESGKKRKSKNWEQQYG
jgi:hypothetical protein